MSSIVLLARLLLAVVFVTAAVGKLADLEGSRRTIAAFGMPDFAARLGGRVLPFVELACAVALMPQPTARWGAVAMGLLLAVFIAAISRALSKGRTPDCNCFGQVSSAQISWRTLARNVALLAIATLVIWKGPGSSLTAWTSNQAASSLVASIAVIACALLGVAAIRYRELNRVLRNRPEAAAPASVPPGLEIGALAPRFSLPDLDGTHMALDDLCGRGLQVLLVFASQSCGPCQALLPELARWNAALGDRITFALVESDIRDPQQLAEQLSAAGEILALYEGGHEVAARYHIIATPTAVVVGADGDVASARAEGSAQIEELIRLMLERGPATRPAVLPLTLVAESS